MAFQQKKRKYKTLKLPNSYNYIKNHLKEII